MRDLSLKSKYDKAIAEIIANSNEFKNAKNIGIFYPRAWEVDLLSLLKSSKACAFPKVVTDNLQFFLVKSLTDLTPGYAGICEPKPATPVIFEATDLICIPGYGFDIHGGRVGSGKGFYDRFLCSVSCLKWGVAYSSQLFNEKVAEEATDVRMDAVVTEKAMVRVK